MRLPITDQDRLTHLKGDDCPFIKIKVPKYRWDKKLRKMVRKGTRNERNKKGGAKC